MKNQTMTKKQTAEEVIKTFAEPCANISQRKKKSGLFCNNFAASRASRNSADARASLRPCITAGPTSSWRLERNVARATQHGRHTLRRLRFLDARCGR